MLESGSPAPEMAFEDTTGHTVRLADHRGQSAVLMYFMRSASCPVCNRHVHDLIKRGDAFSAAGVRVLIAVPEDRADAAAWKARRQVPYTVLTGSAGVPHEAVGLGKKALGTLRQSGSVLIDRQGIVRYARAATLPTAGYDGKAIDTAVRSLPAPA